MEHQEQVSLIKPLLQSAYDLTFNPEKRGGAVGPDWKKLTEEVVLFPNGLDITINAITRAIKWELIDGRVTNITYVEAMFFNKGLKAIKDYLNGTE